MLVPPALKLLEYVDDDITEMTATDMNASVAVLTEQAEDVETIISASVANGPMARPQPAMVSVPTDVPRVPDPASLWNGDASSDRPTPDLELMVLQQDNMRLLRENAVHQRRLIELRAALAEAERQEEDAQTTATRWRLAASEAEEARARAEAARDHYRSFAESSVWTRLIGCKPMRVEPFETSTIEETSV